MKLYVDLDTLQFIEGPGFRSPVSEIRFKRGDSARLDVQFLENGRTPVSIGDPASLALTFGVKLAGAFSAGYLVVDSAWTIPAAPPVVQTYSCEPSFNTAELDTALGIGGAELSELELMGEITYQLGAGAPTSTSTLKIVVNNDVNRGTEGTPMELPSPERWMGTWADIKLVNGIPVAGPIYDVTLDGLTRVLASVGTDLWYDGKPYSPYYSMQLLLDTGTSVWTIYDDLSASTWQTGETMSPVGATWFLVSGTSPNIPAVVESNQFPRIFHDWPSMRTWIVSSPSGDFFELTTSAVSIAAALMYTPADDSNTVHKSGFETIGGYKTFTAQVELNNQAATAGTSAMTRNLARQQRQLLDAYDNWDLFGSLLGMGSGGAAGTGSYSTAGQAQSGSSVGGWSRMVLAAYTTRPSGAGANQGLCAVPMAVSLVGTFSVSDSSAVRITFGAKASGTPYWSNQNPLVARGFGLEIYSVSGVTKMRLFTHNGTTFSYGTAQNFAGIWTGVCHFVIAHNGAGRVQLYHVGSDSHIALGTPALQSGMTMTSGPTSGTLGEDGVVAMEAVGNNTVASSALGNVMRGRMFLNHQL